MHNLYLDRHIYIYYKEGWQTRKRKKTYIRNQMKMKDVINENRSHDNINLNV